MMTNEELQEAKDFLGKSEIPAEWRINLGGMIMKSYRTMKNLLAHVDEQAGQITTLKDALMCHVIDDLGDVRLSNRMADGGYDPRTDEDLKKEATSQLAQEYPEIAWEEKK